MIVWLCVRWWYGAGWRWAWERSVMQRVNSCLQMFSVMDLIRTWGAPFKQTYTGKARGSLDAKFRAALDGFISRVIGFLVRSIVIISGVVSAGFVFVSGIFFVFLWPLVPLTPLISIILLAGGVGK